MNEDRKKPQTLEEGAIEKHHFMELWRNSITLSYRGHYVDDGTPFSLYILYSYLPGVHSLL